MDFTKSLYRMFVACQRAGDTIGVLWQPTQSYANNFAEEYFEVLACGAQLNADSA